MKNGILILVGILLLGVIAFVVYKMMESKEEVKTVEKKKEYIKNNTEIMNGFINEMYGVDFSSVAKTQTFGQRQS